MTVADPVVSPPTNIPDKATWRRWGVNPEWSTVVEASSHDGGVYRWHCLDRPAKTVEPTAPTVVCVHGNPTWSYLWKRFLQRVAPELRMVAVDQLSMGWSWRTATPRTFTQRVADLDDFLAAAGVDGNVVLVAHDWGGPIVLAWALQNRHRVVAVVLSNTGVATPAGRQAPALIRFAAARPVRRLVCEYTNLFVEAALLLSWPRLSKTDRRGFRAPYKHRSRRHGVSEFVGDAPLTDSHPTAAPMSEVASQVGELQVPVLLLWGDRDLVFDETFCADLCSRFADVTVHHVASAGHLLPAEVDVTAVVNDWMSSKL